MNSNRERPRSHKLAEKLKRIREQAGLSQNDMLKRLGFDDRYDRTTISHYENGEREPPLPVLLAYARVSKISVETLIDDEMDF